MRIAIVTGAPSVGKTSVGVRALSEMAEPCAFLDGDSLVVYLPVDLLDRSIIIQDNICACAANYAASGVSLLVASHVFFPQCIERIRDRLYSQVPSAALSSGRVTITIPHTISPA